MQAMRREVQNTVPYHLAIERTAIGANAAVTFTLQVPGDADFELRYLTAQYTSNLATLQITDGGTRQAIFNRPALIALVTGTGAQPYVLPSPALFVRNSSIQVDIADLSGGTNTVQLVAHGFLIYPGPINRG